MSSTEFAAWVQIIAAELREGRRQIVEVARAVPVDRWDRASSVDGWTYKDILSHLAAGDIFCQAVVSAVIGGGPVDLREFGSAREERTANILRQRRQRPISELLDEVKSEGLRTEALISRLTDEDEAVSVTISNSTGAATTLGAYLRAFPDHDKEHIAQLRTIAEVAA